MERFTTRGAADMEKPLCLSNQSKDIMISLYHAYRTSSRMTGDLLVGMQNMIENMDRLRKLLNASEDEKNEMKVVHDEENRLQLAQIQENDRLLNEKNNLIRSLTAKLNDTRNTVASQLREIHALKTDAEEIDNRMSIMKKYFKILESMMTEEDSKQIQFLRDENLYRSHSKSFAAKHSRAALVLPEEETEGDSLDYDQTGDSLDDSEEVAVTRSNAVFRRSSRGTVPPAGGKRSRDKIFDDIHEDVLEGANSHPAKRSKESSAVTTTEITTTVTLDEEGKSENRARVTVRRSMNRYAVQRRRSRSESNLLGEGTPKVSTMRAGLTPRYGMSTQDLRTPRRQQESWTNGYPIDSRPHTYVHSIQLLGTCDDCNRMLNGKAYKCVDCNQCVHDKCRVRLALPCIPRSKMTRTPPRSKLAPNIREFCPPKPPMIAAPVLRCVIELEKRLDFPGIYRVPGRQDQVLRLLDALRYSNTTPKLVLQDTEVIADTLKKFLIKLRDPLIPKTSRSEFIGAAQQEDFYKLNTAICELPQPNRDTLAFLILHWQKVAARSTINKMPIENLARVLAPTVVGDSHHAQTNMASAGDETRNQQAVLMGLLRLDADYWQRFLTFDKDGRRTPMDNILTTPTSAFGRVRQSRRMEHGANVSIVDRSMLGPVSTPAGKGTPHTPTPLLRTTKFFPDLK